MQKFWQWIHLLTQSQCVLKFLKLQKKKHAWGPVSSSHSFIFKYSFLFGENCTALTILKTFNSMLYDKHYYKK